MSNPDIDFFIPNHTQSTQKSLFYLSDSIGDLAYIHKKGDDLNARVVLVKNNDTRTINFHPIDHCVEIPDGYKRCDCMLECEQAIHFIELKDRKDPNNVNHQWVSKGLMQISSTIEIFSKQSYSNQFTISTCFLANRQPFIRTYTNQMMDFNRSIVKTLNRSIPIRFPVFDQNPIII